MVKDPESLDGKPPPQKKRGWWRFVGRHLSSVSVTLMVAMLMIVVLWPLMVITVPTGQVGVLWRRIYGFDFYCMCIVGRGTALDPRELREEGLHLIWPWDRVFFYDLRLQSTTQTYNAISKDGVSVTVQINVRFQLQHNSVAVLHKFIGPRYLESVVAPEIGSQARQVISQYTAQEVYTSRSEIQEKIRDDSQRSLGTHLNALIQPQAMEILDPNHYSNFLQGSISILDTLVLSITLPPEIVAAINRQTEQFYMIQEYKFRVEREAEEARRKQIEANGIAAFQQTVSKGISDSYLRWRGIEATVALAQSQNAKIVIIGAGKDGLPIILGNVDAPAVLGPAPQSGASGQTPPSGASPAPTDKTSPGAPSATLDAAPSGGGPTETPAGISNDNTARAPQIGPTGASPPVPSGLDKQPNSLSLLDRSEIQAILSRIFETLRSSGSPTGSGTGAQPKQ